MKATLAAAALVLSVALPSLASAGCFGAMPTAQSQTSTPVQVAQVSTPAR